METNHLIDLPPDAHEPVIDASAMDEWLASPRQDEGNWWDDLGDLLDGEPEDESPFQQALRITYTSTRK